MKMKQINFMNFTLYLEDYIHVNLLLCNHNASRRRFKKPSLLTFSDH